MKQKLSIKVPEYLNESCKINLIGLLKFNVIFGKNGSGKSILLRSWRDMSPEKIHYIVPERAGEILFSPTHLSRELNGMSRRDMTMYNFYDHYRDSVIARIQSYFIKRGNYRGKNIPGDPDEIEKMLAFLLPEFKIGLQGDMPPYKLIRHNSDKAIMDITNLSSGEAQLLTLGIDIITIAAIWELEGQEDNWILIDEPDLHLHPDLQIRLAEFIAKVAKHFNCKVGIATHSTSLLAAIGYFAEENLALFLANPNESDWIGEPWTKYHNICARVLGGHLLLGTLFAVPILLVEGDDDYKIWSEIPRHHRVQFAVLPCNGEEIHQHQKYLEKLFTAISDKPSIKGIALLDGDKALPTNKHNNPQNYIKFIKLGCRESENLYITDDVLKDIGLTWSEAQQKIRSESSKYDGDKKQRLLSIAESDRKNHDIKPIINQISQILDPKNVPWTMRVGKTLGKGNFSKNMMEFLGEDVTRYIFNMK